MRATFENNDTIIDIGNRIDFDELDTTGTGSCSGVWTAPVTVAVYQRDPLDRKVIRSRGGISLKPSEARAMASALLSAATEAK